MKKYAIIALFSLFSFSAFSGVADNILETSEISGGLVVVIGCDDPELIVDLRASDAYLVHAIDTDQAKVDKAREAIRKESLYGKVSANTFDGKNLPYADNLVNLVVIPDTGNSKLGKEIERILAPRGTCISSFKLQNSNFIVDRVGKQFAHRKPVPTTIDDWTHYLHSPNNNAVAQDSIVGPPKSFQWIGMPRFARSHDHLASVSALVSANGRIFSVVDEGSIAFAAASARWKLVARDAFSGVILWKRDIKKWEWHLRDFRSGPADIARRLVAVGDTVFVTLGYGEPVTALDAATGKELKTYKNTEGTREILCDEDYLYLVRGKPNESWKAEEARETVKAGKYNPPFGKYNPPAHELSISCISRSSGKEKWTRAEDDTSNLMPATLTLSGGRVFFHNINELVCLDSKKGKLRWKAPRPIERRRLGWSSPTVVAHDGIVYAADRGLENNEGELRWLPSGGYHQYLKGKGAKGKLIAYDAKNGKLTCFE